MNKEEILRIDGGIELDGRISEDVMEIPTVVRAGLICNAETEEPIPAYSEDIAAAWQVVEKMRDSGKGCQVNILTGIFREHRVTIREFEVNDVIADVITKDAPEAICKAALLAKLEAA